MGAAGGYAGPFLPHDVISDKKKIGFEFPLPGLLGRSQKLRDYFSDIISELDIAVDGLIDPRAYKQAFAKVLAGESDDYNIWRVINLAMWCSKAVVPREIRKA